MKDIANIFKLSPSELKNINLWEGTAPEIQHFANNLQNFLQIVDTPYVIGLDGGYGTGKTHFSTRFAKQMHAKIKTVYFSAWENDYKNDPLEIFVEQITLLIKTEKQIITNTNFQNVCNLLSSLARSTEISTGLQIGGTFIKITTSLNKFIKNLDKLELSIDVLQKAKYQLANYINLLPHKKLIFIVDDLDRCRPDFAIKVLEIIKHFFDIEGLIVVIPMNQDRLRICINSFYKIPNMINPSISNKEDYLQKFFNEIIDIPNLNYEKICTDRITKQDFKKNLIYTDGVFNSITELQKWITEYSKKCNFSYREMMAIITKAKMFCNYYNEPIRCRLLAYILCDRLNKQKIKTYNQRTELRYGDDDIYVDSHQNPKKLLFTNNAILYELHNIRQSFDVNIDTLINLLSDIPKSYDILYKNIDTCIETLHSLNKEDPINHPMLYKQLQPRLEQMLSMFIKWKENIEKLQKEQGSDDDDLKRIKDYEMLILNPQLLN